MAGWICQTRKILSSVISSLADDLEQTVQDFNDVIHRLNSSNVNRPLKAELPECYNPIEPEAEVLLRSNVQASNLSQNDHTYSPRETYIEAATRQPETCGFLPTLNPRLSRSSPTLQNPEGTITDLMDQEHTWSQGAKSNDQSCASRPSTYYPLSVSSPSLMQVFVTNSSITYEEGLPSTSNKDSTSFEHYTKPRASPKVTRPHILQHVCPCHKGNSLKIATQSLVMKHPGKVIRTQTHSIEEHHDNVNHDSPLKISKETPEVETDSEKPGTSHQGEENCISGISSTLVIVERETGYVRWAALLSLTRVLSFAFTQLTKLVHMLSDEHQNIPTLNSRDMLSIEDARQNVGDDEFPNDSHGRRLLKTMSTDDTEMDGQNALYSTLRDRTFSSESFVIIDSSCFDCNPEDCKENQNKAARISPENEPGTHSYVDSEFGELENDHFDYRHTNTVSGDFTEIISSSAEFIRFDFRKLITNSHFDMGNQSIHHNLEPMSHDEDIARSSHVIAGDYTPNMTFTRTSKSEDVHGNESPIKHYRETHDDGDSSFSIIILSDTDDDNDNEFIFF